MIVRFGYAGEDMSPLYSLEDRMEDAIDRAGVGEFDGDELATDGSDGALYMYGPDADALFAVVKPLLEAAEFMRGARVELRYGPPADGVREVLTVIGA